jgi:hypothetical protein
MTTLNKQKLDESPAYGENQRQEKVTYTYTPDMTRPQCVACGRPVEQADNPEVPWIGTCSQGHEHEYQLDLEEEELKD